MARPRKYVRLAVPDTPYDYGVGYVYAAEFSDGTVKIGFTRSPRNRARTLSVQGRRILRASVCRFAFTHHAKARDARQLERLALAAYRAEFAPIGVRLGEFFRTADFARACELIGARGTTAIYQFEAGSA